MKKRVLHLLSSNQFSGAESVCINMIQSLEDSYDFVYVSPKGMIDDVLSKKRISFIPLKNNSYKEFNKIVKMWKPDIIHAHDFKASVKLAFLKYPAKKISHLHQNPNWIKKLNLKSSLYLISSLKLDNIITVSNEILEETFFSKLIKNKSTVLKNNIDADSILNLANKNKCDEKYDLVFFGRLTAVKNPLRFLHIVKKLKVKYKDIKIVMIGDGDLREDCEKRVVTYDLEDNVKLVGFLSNPFPIINSSKILIMMSEWEGFGLAAVEAMLLGKPVIAPPVGGLKSIITKESGILCETDNEFIQEIINLLDDEKKYNLLSIGARENAMRFSNREVWVNDIKNLYEGISDHS